MQGISVAFNLVFCYYYTQKLKNLGWRQPKIDKLSETKEKQLEEHSTAN